LDLPAILEVSVYLQPNIMARMLKRWESPRKEGRNDKGKGGSARRRQLKKQTQMLRKQLKSKGQIIDQGRRPDKSNEFNNKESHTALLFWIYAQDQQPEVIFCIDRPV
jgi:hypothetical protein